jgi:hypothetical protein
MKKVWNHTVRSVVASVLVGAFIIGAVAIANEQVDDVDSEVVDTEQQSLTQDDEVPYWLATRHKDNAMKHSDGVIAVALKFNDSEILEDVRSVTAYVYCKTEGSGRNEKYVEPTVVELTLDQNKPTDIRGKGKTRRVRVALVGTGQHDDVKVYLTSEKINRRNSNRKDRMVLVGRFINLPTNCGSVTQSPKVPFNCDDVVTEDVLEEEDLDPNNPEPEYIP